MLATTTFFPPSTAPNPTHAPPQQYTAYLPKTPSPLSPRSANIYGRSRFAAFPSMSDSHGSASSSPKIFAIEHGENVEESSAAKSAAAKNPVPFSQRAVKRAPSPRADELKERRRSLFLKKVKEGRDDKRFEGRGEDIMRLDFVQRRKQWEAQLAREAPTYSPFEFMDDIPEEGDESWYELPSSSGAMHMSVPSTQQQQQAAPFVEEEAEEVLRREREELEALLSYMPEEQKYGEMDEGRSEHLYSDDDDYDALFSELMEQDAAGEMSGQTAVQEQGEAMDMS